MAGLGTLTGWVEDAETGARVQGVTVRHLGDPPLQTTTNANGEFTLGSIPGDADREFEFSRSGYVSRQVQRWIPEYGTSDLKDVPLVPVPPVPGHATHVVGSLSQDVTWTLAESPYVLDTVEVAPSATLTIEPGVAVRFAPSGLWQRVPAGSLTVRGRVLASGTVASPISFSSARTSPTARDGTIEMAGTDQSVVSHAAISRLWRFFITAGSPFLTYVTFSDLWYAVSSSATVGSTFTNCDFAGVSDGLGGDAPRAALDWWGAADGPSGIGPGSGRPIYGHAVLTVYEPWLAAPPPTQFGLTAAVVRNRVFNPSAGIWAHISLEATEAASFTLSISNAGGSVIRTFTATGSSATFDWDGKDGGGTPLANGTYAYIVEATAASNGAQAVAAKGRFVLDSTKAFTVSALAVREPFISPNGDGRLESTTVTATTSYPDSTWTLRFLSPSGSAVRTLNGSGDLSFTWDGTADAGAVLPDGTYTLTLDVQNDGATASRSSTCTVDNTPPTLEFTSPAAGATLSNLFSLGATAVPVEGTAADDHISSWNIQYGVGASPSSWTGFGSGSASVTSGLLGTWETKALANGTYTFRLYAQDRAHNESTLTRTVTLGNVTVTASGRELNVADGGTVTLTTITPFPVTETIELKDAPVPPIAASTVRTLVSAAPRAPGTYVDSWDGSGDGDAWIRDGQYRWVATFTDGTHSLTIDRTAELDGGYEWKAHPDYPAWDPFNNEPLRFGHKFDKPGEIGLVFMRNNVNYFLYDCNPPSDPESGSFCRWFDEFQPSGDFNYEWAGVDLDGVYRPDIKAIYVISNHEQLSANAVVVSGGRPKVTNVTVSPPYYDPDLGKAAISFSLQTFKSAAVLVKITIVNQESKSLLRTISLPSATPGVVTATWDGRTDGGLLVAPGLYTVTVKALDAVGHLALGQIQMTIEY